MSILGHNCLDAAYGQLSDLNLGNIISYADKYMKQKTLNQTSSTGNVDGMALSLIHYTKASKMMLHSSANHYIYIVRDNELIEIKDNSFAVGSLQTQEIKGGKIQLMNKDMVYLFSDGYADQKGGPERRKYMPSKLKKLFVQIASLSAKEQQAALNSELDNWRGNLPQIDDVLVVGLRV